MCSTTNSAGGTPPFQDNLAAEGLNLTADEIKVLDEVSTLPPEYPGWMLAFQDVGRLGATVRPVWEDFRESSSNS